MPIPLAVLIVEDTESDAQLTIRLLKKAGYKVTSEQVETAEQMRAALEKRSWDIVIADYSLPQFDGCAALELLKEKQLDIPFIVVTGTMGEDSAVAIMKAGAHDYLMKGNLARLAPAVKRELEQAQDRREYKLAEQALRLSQSTYQGIINSITEAVYIQDEHGTFLDVNLPSEKMYGYSRSDFIGRTPEFLSAPGKNDLAKIAEFVRKAFEEGESQKFEFWGLRKDGSIFPKDVSLTPGTYFGRKVVIAVARDITGRKQAEEALRLAEEKYRNLVEQIPVVMYLDKADELSSSIYISPQVGDLLGYPPVDFLENPNLWHKLIFPDDYELATTTIQKTIKNGHASEEYRMITRDGRVIWTRDTSVAIHDETGNLRFIQGFIEDITERKQVEIALQKVNEQLHLQLNEIRELHATLHDQAIHDPLTKLYNRRYMQEAIAQEYARASREEFPVSIVILDLDHLKEINSKYGHVTGGDKALQVIGEHLKAMTRAGDVACRYGGDEFLIILHNTPTHVAYERAEQWRKSLAKMDIDSNGTKFNVSFSAGVAAFPANGQDMEEVLQAADAALFQAKEMGSNCVVLHTRD